MKARALPKSAAAKRFDRLRQEAAAAIAATRAAKPCVEQAPESTKPSHAFGEWPMANLGSLQCRFACTPHHVRPEDHRFCGRQTHVGKGNLHGSWCADHLPGVWGTGTKSEQMAADRPRGA